MKVLQIDILWHEDNALPFEAVVCDRDGNPHYYEEAETITDALLSVLKAEAENSFHQRQSYVAARVAAREGEAS